MIRNHTILYFLKHNKQYDLSPLDKLWKFCFHLPSTPVNFKIPKIPKIPNISLKHPKSKQKKVQPISKSSSVTQTSKKEDNESPSCQEFLNQLQQCSHTSSQEKFHTISISSYEDPIYNEMSWLLSLLCIIHETASITLSNCQKTKQMIEWFRKKIMYDSAQENLYKTHSLSKVSIIKKKTIQENLMKFDKRLVPELYYFISLYFSLNIFVYQTNYKQLLLVSNWSKPQSIRYNPSQLSIILVETYSPNSPYLEYKPILSSTGNHYFSNSIISELLTIYPKMYPHVLYHQTYLKSCTRYKLIELQQYANKLSIPITKFTINKSTTKVKTKQELYDQIQMTLYSS